MGPQDPQATFAPRLPANLPAEAVLQPRRHATQPVIRTAQPAVTPVQIGTGERLLLRNYQAPGDALVMTAAIESLHLTYPGQYLTDVDVGSCQPVYYNNPRITKLDHASARIIDMKYDIDASIGINQSDTVCLHFMHGFTNHLADALGKPIRLRVNRPQLYLDKDEISKSQIANLGIGAKYWIINAGHKSCYTAKWWGTSNYQGVVDALKGKITFVQIGERAPGHTHPPLKGVIDMVGKTTIRQFISLCWHAQGGVGPSTFLQHVMAALQKPYVCLLGGREPVQWTAYAKQTTMHAIGALSCCQNGACWKSRTYQLHDGDKKDQEICLQPIYGQEIVPRCLAMVSPDQVAEAILKYPMGGGVSF